jgi:ABC-type transporter Mla subunit MlaD
MWNPLSVPFAVLEAIVAIPRGVAVLEEAVAQAAALNERGDLVLEELAEARATFAEAMLQIDRLTEHGDAAIAAIESTRPTAERIAASAEPMIEAAGRARDQLKDAQAELARANEQLARALEMAEPLDRMTSRAQKLAGSLRRGDDT